MIIIQVNGWLFTDPASILYYDICLKIIATRDMVLHLNPMELLNKLIHTELTRGDSERIDSQSRQRYGSKKLLIHE